MIRTIPANLASGPVETHSPASLRQSVQSIIARKRVGSVMIYTMGALFLAVLCSFLFNSLEHDTEFAIAIMGSLIGGFLGAMLASALIVDIYLPKRSREMRHESEFDRD